MRYDGGNHHQKAGGSRQDDLFILGEQAGKRVAEGQQSCHQHERSHKGDAARDGNRLTSPWLIPRAQCLSDQCNPRRGHTVSKGEGQAGHLADNPRRSKDAGAQGGNDAVCEQEARAQGTHFQQGGAANAPQPLNRVLIKDRFFDTVTEGRAFFHRIPDGQDTGCQHPQVGGDGGAGNFQSWKAQPALNQQIVEEKIDHIAGQMGHHGHTRFPQAAESRANA